MASGRLGAMSRMEGFLHQAQWRRNHGARGARAPHVLPHFSRWLGTGGGTVEERLITIIYCNMPSINAKNQE